MLSHNILDSFGETGIVAVTKGGFVPARSDGGTVEFNIVFDDVLIILHLQVVDAVFSVASRVDWAKLSTKGTDECIPIVHPIWEVVRVKKSRLKILMPYHGDRKGRR